MTAVECINAVKFAVWNVFGLKGLTVWQRAQLTLLKIVAVCGYHYGKYLSVAATTPNSPVVASHQEALRAVRAVNGSVVFHICGVAAVYSCYSSSASCCRVAKVQPAVDGHNYIAVVLPVYLRCVQDLALLFKVLDHLSKQKRPADIIILVDDASPFPIPSIIAHEKLVLIQLRCNKGPATGRNCGIALAKERGANVICFLDADCQPSSDWIAMMEKAQQKTPGIVCGKTLSDAPRTAVGLYHEVFGTLNGRMLSDGSVLYGCTCNLSISVAGVDLVFDSSYPAASFEDVEFCIRAKKNRIRMTYHPFAVVHHHFEPGWYSLFCQFRRYGRFERQTALKHREYLPWLWSSHEISCCSDNGLTSF